MEREYTQQAKKLAEVMPKVQPLGSMTTAGQLTTNNHATQQLTTLGREESLKLVTTILECDDYNWMMKSYSNKPCPPVFSGAPLQIAKSNYEKLQEKLRCIADVEFIKIILVKLQGHFWVQGMTESLAREVASDYVRLLDGYPKIVWEKAYDQLLLESDRKFMPKVGELEKVLKHSNSALLYKAKKLGVLCGA